MCISLNNLSMEKREHRFSLFSFFFATEWYKILYYFGAEHAQTYKFA